MSEVKLRLGPTLTFDDKKDAYIMERIEYLNKTHQMKNLLTYLIKVVFDDPTMMDTEKNMEELFGFIQKSGATPNVAEFMRNASNEINDMQEKINEMHRMCKEMYTLSLFRKEINPEAKVENMLTAEFMLQRQVINLEDKLGINITKTFDSSKVADAKNDAESALEYIITHYSGIVDEIKESQNTVIVKQAPPVDNTVQDKTEGKNSNTASKNVTAEIEKVDPADINGGDEVDFGETFEEMADIEALMRFTSGMEDGG